MERERDKERERERPRTLPRNGFKVVIARIRAHAALVLPDENVDKDSREPLRVS